LPGPPSPGHTDRKVESAVLAFVLDEHPNRLTIPEVSWAMSPRGSEFAHGDAIERAVRELVGAGLLHVAEGFVLPTRAALHFYGLEQD